MLDIKISNDNILEWSHFEDWENGASSAPTEHTLTGAGASVARESTTIKTGTYSCKITRSGADAVIYHQLSDHTPYVGRKVTLGAWVWADTASQARISIYDGSSTQYSSYHTGGSSWEFLSVTYNLPSTTSALRAQFNVDVDGASYFDAAVMCLGDKVFNNLTESVDIGKWTPSIRYRVQRFSVARQSGSTIPNTFAESKSINIEGAVVEADADTARTTYDSLIKDLSSFYIDYNGDKVKKNLYLFDDRYLKVFLQNISPSPLAALRVINFRASFISPDPCEYAVNKSRSATTIDSSPKTYTVTTQGTESTSLVLKLTAGSADVTAFTIENLTSFQKFSYTGTVTSGDDLILDSENLMVTNNGVEDLDNTTNELGLTLYPGANEITVTLTGGSTDSVVRIDWFDRYL